MSIALDSLVRLSRHPAHASNNEHVTELFARSREAATDEMRNMLAIKHDQCRFAPGRQFCKKC
jgi:hypothetical protein